MSLAPRGPLQRLSSKFNSDLNKGIQIAYLVASGAYVTRGRVIAANVLIGFLLAASAYDVFRDEEHWPFSQYPMFSRIAEKRELTWLRLYVVTLDGQEFPLITHRQVFPFDQSRLSKALGAIRTRPDADVAIHAALANCLERYERLRLAHRHDGPQAARMRLYEVTWTLHPGAANLDTPDSRTLVGEVAP
jgi:hypothetical protein